MLLQLAQELRLLLTQRVVDCLSFLVQSADKSQVAVDVVGDEIHFIDELVEVGNGGSHGGVKWIWK